MMFKHKFLTTKNEVKNNEKCGNFLYSRQFAVLWH